MVRARKAKGLTQKQLAAKVGTSQNIISLIESGEVRASSYVMKIAKTLEIAPPLHHGDDETKLWAALGHKLRIRNRKQFERAMALIRGMVDDDENDESSR